MTRIPEPKPTPKSLRARAVALRNAASLQRTDNASGNSPVNFGNAYYERTVQGLDREIAKLEAEANQIELDNYEERGL